MFSLTGEYSLPCSLCSGDSEQAWELVFVVESEGKNNKNKGGTEIDVELKVKDKHGEDRGDEHGARDEEEPRNVVTVFEDG